MPGQRGIDLKPNTPVLASPAETSPTARGWGLVGLVTLGGFLTAGLYKQGSIFQSLPDLTVVFAVLTLLACLGSFIATGFAFPRHLGLVVVFYMTLFPGIFGAHGTYDVTKVSQAFTLGILATIAPLFLIRSNANVRRFLWILTIIGCSLAVLALAGANNPLEHGRFDVLDATTISTGRIIGATLIWILLLTLGRQLPKVIGIPLSAGLIYAMIGTGSRGPLLALIAAIVIDNYRAG